MGNTRVWPVLRTTDLSRALADLTVESGRGLFVIGALTRHWGVRPLADNVGRVVFAVLGP